MAFCFVSANALAKWPQWACAIEVIRPILSHVYIEMPYGDENCTSFVKITNKIKSAILIIVPI